MTAQTAETPPETEERTQKDEIEEILAEPHTATIAGREVKIKRMRTRELLKALRILTEGMGGQLALMSMPENPTPTQVTSTLMAAFVNSIPHAEDAVVDFIRAMVIAPDDTKDARALAEELRNPDIETMIEVIGAVVENERGNFANLGKAVMTWVRSTRAG